MVVLAHQVGCRWLCHAAGCASSVLAGWRAILMCRGAGLQGAPHILRANRSGFPLVQLAKAGAFPWLGACREELFRCFAVQIPSRRPSACGWCLENPWYELHTQNSARGEGVSRENPRLWASGALHLPGAPAAAPGRAPGADCTQGSSPPDKMQGHEQDSDQMRGDPRKCKTWATLRPDLGVEPCLIIALAR